MIRSKVALPLTSPSSFPPPSYPFVSVRAFPGTADYPCNPFSGLRLTFDNRSLSCFPLASHRLVAGPSFFRFVQFFLSLCAPRLGSERRNALWLTGIPFNCRSVVRLRSLAQLHCPDAPLRPCCEMSQHVSRITFLARFLTPIFDRLLRSRAQFPSCCGEPPLIFCLFFAHAAAIEWRVDWQAHSLHTHFRATSSS